MFNFYEYLFVKLKTWNLKLFFQKGDERGIFVKPKTWNVKRQEGASRPSGPPASYVLRFTF